MTYKILLWFESNMMVAIPSKFQVMFMGLGNDYKLCMESLHLDEMVITTIDKVKLLGVIIDSKLNFDEHVKSLGLKTNRNIRALSRTAKIIDPPRCKMFYNSFLCQTSSILPSFGCSVERLLIKNLQGS